ncbi:MAG: hypothetical protein ACLT16_04985 [[Clostridium] innocuum]
MITIEILSWLVAWNDERISGRINQESGLKKRYHTIANQQAIEGVLLELKVAKREEDLQKLAEQACKQIIDMKYIEGLE